MKGVKKVAVIGSTGQLGTDVVKAFREDRHFEVVGIPHEQLDCTNLHSVRQQLLSIRPQIVINCAAFVRVDDCEDNPDRAFQVNALGALNVARFCATTRALCVYVSTDYVFDGSKQMAYDESDRVSPINVYGASKLAGEYLVQQAAARWLIVRVASLFGNNGSRTKGNFIETILSRAEKGEPLRIVNDVRMSPTYTWDAAGALVDVIKGDGSGIVHMSNTGSCTWYEFARTALDLAAKVATIEPVTSAEYATKARRPANSSLVSHRTQDFLPRPLRPWPEALEAYLIETGHLR